MFVPDAGVDTGPIVVQKGGVEIAADDTTGSLYFSKLYPLGVNAVCEAVRAIADGSAVPRQQDESLASHQGLVDDTVAAIDLSRPAAEVDRLVRGCDPSPGAFVRRAGAPLRLFDVRLEAGADAPVGTVLEVAAAGMSIALDGGALRVGRVRADAGKLPAAEFAEAAGLHTGDRLENG